MSLILSGTDGLSDVDGSAATPAIRGTDANTGIFFPAADTIAFAEGGAEVARFDSSGNFGLGVTPSAWAANSAAFQNSAGSIWRFGTGNIYLGQNYYYNGTNRIFVNNGYASEYNQNGSSHNWYSSNNGTAGGTVSQTQVLGVGIATTLFLQGASASVSGTGISFPATQSASTDANTLDDYEEGTLTTTFSSPVNLTGTPALGKGRYTKVGRLVSIQGEVTGYSITTANTLTYFVMTLPFVTVGNTEAFSGSVTETNSYSVGTILDSSSGSDNTIFLGFRAASVPSSGSATYHFSLTYMSA
jgi:hypothetical protein